jgi:hypothetical protein
LYWLLNAPMLATCPTHPILLDLIILLIMGRTRLFSVALQSLKDLGRLTYWRFLELFRHMVGLLGRVISPSQGLYLPTQDNTTQKDADKHPCLERDSNPRSQQPTDQDPRLRQHGHCDRQGQILCFNLKKFLGRKNFEFNKLSESSDSDLKY